MENILQLKTVKELTALSFFIPSYQRGYRWSVKEVEDLLNDVFEFRPKEVEGKNEKTWYCLQPIVITKRDDSFYEVIDGQQRLTTIFLILHFLNQQYTKDFQEPIFELEYETRSDSAEFLKELGNAIDSSNIDFHFMSQAYAAIGSWFRKPGFDRNDFQSKFNFNTKVIWYESIEDDPIAIFTRINIGKIPLSNAELVKALFLNSSNFEGKKNSDKIRLKQIEISSEWDQIEHALRNDRLWYFIGGNEIVTNRIEFILNLMNKESDPDDTYSTFRFFNSKFTNKSQELIESNWIEIKNYFQRFDEWFKEKELYHKIGYLISIEVESITSLIEISSKSTKKQFKKFLDDSIRRSVKNVNLENLQYGDKNVKRVLLLYNILAILKNHHDSAFFPFDIYRKEKWDIEHITSVTDSVPDSSHQAQWLEDAVKFIEDPILKKKAESFDSNSDFTEIFTEIVAHFNKDLKDSDINDISNLTLLDYHTNRGYKNAVFPIKRMTIIKREREGTYIPLCTKNVFLKYFSEYPPKISFWAQEDRENYYSDIVEILSPYLS
ncbi:MAG: DUF262 domain-containing protein [Bacteroidetes bacterium]|nr:DUF262 domain-containing protein [Bacteroidota bacterium]